MARTTEKIEALTTSDIPASKMSLEEIQREIAEVELQTARLGLEAQKKTNADFVEKERRRREANQKRMDELAVARNNYYAQIRECRHRAGGNPKSHLRGGSGANAFSVLTRNIMPDSMTILVTCGRCFLKIQRDDICQLRALQVEDVHAGRRAPPVVVQKPERRAGIF